MGSDTFMQTMSRVSRIRNQNMKGQSGAPFLGSVTAVNSHADTMLVEHYGGAKNIKISHPYLGNSSWHRIGPDPGMGVVLQQRVDSKEEHATTYSVQPPRDGPPNKRLEDYDKDLDTFRPIFPGEHDIASRGQAQIYMGRRPVIDIRAGAIHSSLDQDRLESVAKAPTHRLLVHTHNSSKIGNEARFGVVSRPATVVAGGKEYSYVDLQYIHEPALQETGGAVSTGTANAYAMENMYVLKTESNNSTLVDHREGHVVDDHGSLQKGSFHNNLRFSKKLFTTNQEVFQVEVDDHGNLGVKLPSSATSGFDMTVPGGNFKLSVGSSGATTGSTSTGDLSGGFSSIQSSVDLDVGGNFSIKSQQAVKIIAQATALLSGITVSLGSENATEPLILGTQYQVAMSALCSAVSSAQTADSTVWTTAATAMTTAGTAASALSVAPLTPGVLITAVLTPAFAALAAAFTSLATSDTTQSTAFNTFSGQITNHLSQSVKTK